MSQPYSVAQPTRAEIDALNGPAVLEFGTDWCGFCRAAQAPIATAMGRHPDVRRLKVEDGPGRALGRSFRVKLWPTLVFLSNGQEVGRLVRPYDPEAIDRALAQLDASPP